MKKPLYKQLASLVAARLNCIKSGNSEWESRHEERIETLVKNHMPSGSGIDNGTTIDLDKSTDEKLVFDTSYHHMDENGWTDHTIIVKGSLLFDFDLTIGGVNRNDIKEYLADVFQAALSEEIEYE